MRILGRIRRLQVPEAAGWPPSDRELTLRRAWPRGPGHLLLEYRSAGGRLVAGQWFADGSRSEAVTRRTAAQAGDGRAIRCGDVLLQAGGADRRLRGLAGILADPGARLVSHRPERRAVVRIERGACVRYAKVVRPGRVAGLLETADRASAAAAIDTPGLIWSNSPDGVTVWSALRGRSLYDLLDSEALIPAARATGTALHAFHAARIGDLRPHSPAHEREVVSTWMANVTAYDSSIAVAPRSRFHAVDALLRAAPTVVGVPIHRDFYDKQVFVAGDGRVGMLDFDTLALGDPALDLANVLVHLELRALQGHCKPERAHAAATALVSGYQPDAHLVARLPAYAAAARLRLACVYRFRPDWTELAHCLGSDPLGAPLGFA
jgi:hypothetical protein